MDNSGYVALSKERALFRQMDVVANNIANADTTGYKSDGMIFEQFLVNAGNHEKVAFTNDVSTYKDMSQGQLVSTYRDLDAAISGEGFFVVNTPLGPRYTRAGNFVMRSDGALVTQQGYEVLDEGGQPIVFQEEDSDIVIREDGTITVGSTNDERGKIRLVRFDNPQKLQKLPGGFFKTDDPALPVDENETKLQQGMIEKSNVSSVQETVNMIKISRAAGNTGKMLSDLHDLEMRAIDTLGKTQ